MIKLIKRQLDLAGAGCTYLSFSKEKIKNKETGEWELKNAFKALMKNESGGKDTVVLTINKPLNLLEVSDFQNLFNILKDGKYQRGS